MPSLLLTKYGFCARIVGDGVGFCAFQKPNSLRTFKLTLMKVRFLTWRNEKVEAISSQKNTAKR